MFNAEDKRVGSSDKTRQYDLPLHQDEGTGFLIVLVGLMAFLSTIVLSFSFTLNTVMDGWSEGLENKITLEIPAKIDEDTLRSSSEIKKIQASIIEKMSQSDIIKTITPVEEKKLQTLVQSWLGQSTFIDDLPMPSLISIELHESSPEAVNAISTSLREIDKHTLIDTHETWLDDLLKLTRSMQSGIFAIVLVIALTTVAAIAGAMKSQIEIHRNDVELLHLMGARDQYITNQFVRHASILSLTGAFAGLVSALCIMALIGFVFKDQDYGFLPKAAIHWGDISVLCLLPLIICGISAGSARYTVMQVLQRMP